MPRPRPPYLQREFTRHGKAKWYVRVGKGSRVQILAEYGTDEFQQEYQAAIAGRPLRQKAGKARTGSLRWLYDRYRESAAWLDLSEATRRQRQNILGHVMDLAADEPFTKINRASIEAGKNARRATPSQARNFLDAMRGLFRWALDDRHVRSDPTAGVKNPTKRSTDGFKAWDEADVAKFVKRWPKGTRQYVWLHVLVYVGCRRGDAVNLGKQHIKDGAIHFVIQKGRNKRRIDVSRRIEPELAEALEAGPTGDLAFICGERGEPLTKESFGNFFKNACVQAGILDKSAHGLRKLSATIWAERGATVHELMALFGWVTVQMAELYTRGAHRKKLSLGAADRLLPPAVEKAREA